MKHMTFTLRTNLLSKLLLSLALLIGNVDAWADGTLTAFSGATSTTNNFPLSGGYVNTQGIRSEFIIPSTELTSMTGKIITKLTFFHRDPKDWGSVQVKVYLKEVNQTTFSSKDFLGTYDSPVYDGTLSFNSTPNGDSQYELDITCDAPFNYSGGHLLVGFYCSVAGKTGYPNFYGDYKSGTYYGLYTTYLNGTFYYNNGNYRLKTKFTYEDATTPVLSISHPEDGDDFGYVTENTTKSYTVNNIGAGSMDVNITSSDAAFTLSTSSLTGITNDGEGQTFNVTFNYDAGAPKPHSATITVTPTFGGAVAQSFTVTAGPEVYINEDAATTWTTGSGKNVYVKYTAVNGWNTICLPISPNIYKTQLFGSGAAVTFYALNAYDSETGTLTFEKASYPSAGTPYLAYVENAASSSFLINSIYVGYAPTATPTTTQSSAKFRGTFAPIAAGDFTSTMYGVTRAGEVRPGDGVNASMKGYRAYFTGVSAPASGGNVKMFIIGGDDIPTDLGFVKMVDADAKEVYNLAGQRVQKARKGIYVVNGKKVVIK